MFFHALTFAESRGRCLNMRMIGQVLKHLPRDLQVLVQHICDCYSSVFYLIPTKFALKTLLKHLKKYSISYTEFL